MAAARQESSVFGPQRKRSPRLGAEMNQGGHHCCSAAGAVDMRSASISVEQTAGVTDDAGYTIVAISVPFLQTKAVDARPDRILQAFAFGVVPESTPNLGTNEVVAGVQFPHHAGAAVRQASLTSANAPILVTTLIRPTLPRRSSSAQWKPPKRMNVDRLPLLAFIMLESYFQTNFVERHLMMAVQFS